MAFTSRMIFIQTLTNYVRFFFSIGVAFLVTPMIIRSVGIDDFGLWVFVMSLVGLFEMLDFGLHNTVIKYVVESEALNSVKERNKVLSTIFFSYIILAVVGMFGIGILVFLLYDFSSSIESQEGKVIALIGILSVKSILLGLPLSLFKALLIAIKRITESNIVTIISELIYALIIIKAVNLGMGIVDLAWINFFKFGFQHLLFVMISFYALRNLKIRFALIDVEFIKKSISFTLMQFVGAASSMISLKLDPIIIKMILPFGFVGIYAIPLKLVTYAYMLIKQFTTVFSPVISHLYAKNDQSSLTTIIFNCSKYATAFGTVLCISGISLGEPFIVHWVGEEFAPGGVVLSILLLSMWVSATQFIFGQVLGLTGFHKKITKYFIGGTLVNIVTSLVLVYPLGINGVALGTLVGAIFSAFAFTNGMVTEYKIKIDDWAKFVIIPSILPGIFQWVALSSLKIFVNVESFLDIFAIGIVGAVTFLAFFWLLSFSEKEKKYFLNVISPQSIGDE